jgi:heme exporter protein A
MLGGAGGLSPRQALEKLALSHATDLPVGYLSAGQKRRAALARLLIAPRPLWLLDEPATALDSASQNRFALVMSAHLAAGGIIIAATHAPLGLDNARELKMGTAA